MTSPYLKPGQGYCELRIIAPNAVMKHGLEFARVGPPIYIRVTVVPAVKQAMKGDK